MAATSAGMLDVGRHLEVGERLAHPVAEVVVVEVAVGHQLHDGLDLLAELLVGHAEHGDIGHLGMADQQVFDLLRQAVGRVQR